MFRWILDDGERDLREWKLLEDKKQITCVYAGTLTRDFLPLQLVYNGTTSHCLPTLGVTNRWTTNHWTGLEWNPKICFTLRGM